MIKRENPPKPTSEISFHLPEIHQFKLSNGIKIHLVNKPKLPIVQLTIMMEGGSRFDPEGKEGLSYMNSILMDEGAGPYNSLQLNEEIEFLGSSINVSIDDDSLYVSMLSLVENLEATLTLTKYITCEPRFEQADFDREKQKLLSWLPQVKNYPDLVAENVFQFVLHGEENPYSRYLAGYMDSVQSIKLEDVQDFYKNYIAPDNMEFIIVGSVDLISIQSLLEKLFGTFIRTAKKIESESSAQLSENRIYLYDKKDANQTEIKYGHISDKRNSEDYFAKMICNKILGGQFTSRLNLNLREEKGLTYGINSTFRYFKKAAEFNISTSVNTESTIKAIEEIVKEVEGMKENITDEEIDFAKISLIREFPSRFETNSQIATNLAIKIKYELEQDNLNKFVENVSAVIKNDVLESARKSFKTENAIFVLVGDKKEILSQLKNSSLDYEVIEVDFNGRRISYN
jgi:zinc protease